MSMLDSFFAKGFKASKCKTLLKLTIPRIKLLRNRREIQIKQMRREIAKLLETGQEATARIRVEHIIREEKMMAAQEIVELFCELIAARLPIIEVQRECPLDLKEAISSVCFAAPRCADLPELLQAQMLFAGKYGKEFVSAATELMPECGVNRQLVELLSIRAPAPDVKLKLLKEIAEENELDWEPSAFESELLKTHQDLLNGPTQFVSSSKIPIPEEKHDETKSTTSGPESHNNSDSDSDYEIIDFSEVPDKLLHLNKGTTLVPEMLPFPESALSEVDDEEEEETFSSIGNENLPHLQPMTREESSPSPVEEKQFEPFIYTSSHNEQNYPYSISYANSDLHDILAAAQEAAESAERAATAARSAASIAQLRISELVNKENDRVIGSSIENPFHLENRGSISPSYDDSSLDHVDPEASAYGAKWDVESSPYTCHQPERLPAMDEETVFSYPNLFTSQESDMDSRSRSFTDTPSEP